MTMIGPNPLPSRAADEARLWPLWSQQAMEGVNALLRGGDMAAAAARQPLLNRCQDLARTVLAPGRDVLVCGSGTAALQTAYASLGLEPGSEVLAATTSFRATVTAMFPHRLTPVLCDTDPVSGVLSLQDAAARLTPRTAALVVTHHWGRPAPLDALTRFADRHHLAVIEDCSHAHGTCWQGRPVGSAADVAVWSAGTWKMVSGGTAGLLSARDPRVFDRALLLTQPKHRALTRLRDTRLRALAATGTGHNLRPTPVAALLATDHLERLGHTLATKNERQSAVEALLAHHLPALRPLPAAHGRTRGALYKWHWCLDPGGGHELSTVLGALRRAGVRAALPARPLHEAALFTTPGLAADLPLPHPPQIPLPDPDSFPGTARLMDRLIELDTRDMYDPLPDGDPDPYDQALRATAAALRTTTRKARSRTGTPTH